MLLVRLVRARPRGVLLVPYMGQLDVLVLWPLARLLRLTVVLDVFISLYDTLVDDRRMVSAASPLAGAVKMLERLALGAADLAILDTATHARRLETLFGLAPHRLGHVFVGVEEEAFSPAPPTGRENAGKPLQVLFYGQLSPLHGVETILEAARRLGPRAMALTLIGSGQQDGIVQRLLVKEDLSWVTWLKWTPYDELREHIRRSDVSLGVFGASAKAGSVIPNKVFQIACVGRYIVTRDCAAVRELFTPDDGGVTLIPPADPTALADALADLQRRRGALRRQTFHAKIRSRICRRAIGQDLVDEIARASALERRR